MLLKEIEIDKQKECEQQHYTSNKGNLGIKARKLRSPPNARLGNWSLTSVGTWDKKQKTEDDKICFKLFYFNLATNVGKKIRTN